MWRASALLAIALAATSCHEAAAVQCGELLCPVGLACVAGQCVAPGTAVCGDGAVDESGGEACDDGNLASHDGCSSQCQTERLTWNPLEDNGGPASRQLASLAYDSSRERYRRASVE